MLAGTPVHLVVFLLVFWRDSLCPCCSFDSCLNKGDLQPLPLRSLLWLLGVYLLCLLSDLSHSISKAKLMNGPSLNHSPSQNSPVSSRSIAHLYEEPESTWNVFQSLPHLTVIMRNMDVPDTVFVPSTSRNWVLVSSSRPRIHFQFSFMQQQLGSNQWHLLHDFSSSYLMPHTHSLSSMGQWSFVSHTQVPPPIFFHLLQS